MQWIVNYLTRSGYEIALGKKIFPFELGKKWMNEIISFSLVLQIDLMHTQTHVKNWYNGE